LRFTLAILHHPQAFAPLFAEMGLWSVPNNAMMATYTPAMDAVPLAQSRPISFAADNRASAPVYAETGWSIQVKAVTLAFATVWAVVVATNTANW
jgi:hypothetical protein